MTTIPTRLRQREILDAQLSQCRRVDNSFTRGAVAALHWLTEGGVGPLSGALATSITFPAIVHEPRSGRGHHLRTTLHGARVRPRRGARSVVGGERHVWAARPRLQPARRPGMRNGTRATAVVGAADARPRRHMQASHRRHGARPARWCAN